MPARPGPEAAAPPAPADAPPSPPAPADAPPSPPAAETAPLPPGIPDLAAQPQPPAYTPAAYRAITVNGSTYKTDLTGALIGRVDATGVWRPGVDPADAPTLALHGFPAVGSYDIDAPATGTTTTEAGA